VATANNARDLLLLVAAVGVGLLLYNYLAVPIALLGLSLVQWTGVSAGTSASAVSLVPDAVAAFAIGGLLVLAIARFARNPRRLAYTLAITFPVVLVIGLAAYITTMSSLVEAISFAIRTFAVESLAFAAGCLVTSRLLPVLR
jgi:hypothetical protein